MAVLDNAIDPSLAFALADHRRRWEAATVNTRSTRGNVHV